MAIKIAGNTVIDDSRNLTNINSLAEATWEAGVSTTETVVSPAKVKAAIDSLSGGMTLLGTLTTTSGTVQTLSSLDLSDYTYLWISFNLVSHDSGLSQDLRIYDSATSSRKYSIITSFSNTEGIIGVLEIDLVSGFQSIIGKPSVSTTPLITTSTTSISFVWGGTGLASFDNGSIKIYGVK